MPVVRRSPGGTGPAQRGRAVLALAVFVLPVAVTVCAAMPRSLGGRVLRLDSERRLEAAVRLYRSYGFEEIGDYNRNPRAEIWMELRLGRADAG